MMSNISSDTLFHFTNWDNLISILANGFQPKFSLERHCFRKGLSTEIAIPMVSFCDIPLAQIKLHVKRYGSYGLGLSKDWGIAQGMNPVLYLKENSNFSLNMLHSLEILRLIKKLSKKSREDLQDVERQLSNIKKKGTLSDEELKVTEEKLCSTIESDVDNIEKVVDAVMTILMHIKQYDGYSLRRGEKRNKVRFYDEREWRFVPRPNTYMAAFDKLGIVMTDKEAFNNHRIRSQANALVEATNLNFKPSFIRYIIVKKEDEILKMITNLEHIKGDKYPANIIKILTSRILTYEQIEKDF